MTFFFWSSFPWKAQIASSLMGSWSSQRSWKATSSREGDRFNSRTSASSKIGWTRMPKQLKKHFAVLKLCAVWSTTHGTPPRPLLTTSVSCDGRRRKPISVNEAVQSLANKIYFIAQVGFSSPGSRRVQLFLSLVCSFEEGIPQ